MVASRANIAGPCNWSLLLFSSASSFHCTLGSFATAQHYVVFSIIALFLFLLDVTVGLVKLLIPCYLTAQYIYIFFLF